MRYRGTRLGVGLLALAKPAILYAIEAIVVNQGPGPNSMRTRSRRDRASGLRRIAKPCPAISRPSARDSLCSFCARTRADAVQNEARARLKIPRPFWFSSAAVGSFVRLFLA